MKPKVSFGIDHIYNDRPYGSVADRLLANGLDLSVLRPYTAPDENGVERTWITNAEGEGVLTNTPGIFPKEAWISLDETVERVQRDELQVVSDLTGAGLTYTLPNGMGTPMLQEQTMTDFGVASVSMSGLKRTERDRPEYDLKNFPIPIIHGEWSWDLRTLEIYRKTRTPIDTTSAEMIARRIAELVEQMTLGTAATYSYGGAHIYGLSNHPNRITSTMTLPTAGGWTPMTTVNEVIDLIDSLKQVGVTGPYGVYFSPNWSKYMGKDYYATSTYTYSGETLLSRLQKISPDRIRFWKEARWLNSGFQVLVVQLRQDTVRMVSGLPMTTLQWDEQGGLEKKWKIIQILVPQVRTHVFTAASQVSTTLTGIGHGVAA